MLELINVKKLYQTKAGDTAALDNVSIQFPKTGMIFITGKSGSGKTTMLNVIGGLDGIDEGEIIIEGKKFSEFSSADYDSYRNTFVGFIFQEYNLLPEYTVAKNISMANELQGRKTVQSELEKLLESVDMSSYGSRKISQLSGGQKQRVAIARALIKNPQIIMADEPTGALDSATGVQVMETLKKLSSEKLIIVVSHDLELAEKYADRIITLVDGKIFDDVTLNSVEFDGSYYESGSEVVVKTGGDLTKSQTESLINAIKEKKKISVTDKISIKEKSKTKPIEREEVKHPVKLINSKMKLKSAVELGVKSLFVKPFRLIITILLSVVAFAVFGLFDSVASFSGARISANALRTGGYPSVSVYATINDGNYNNEKLKLSQEYVDQLNKKTGYKFRGVYDIVDVENGSRSNINMQYAITTIGTRTITSPQGVGYNYYDMNVSGYVEFKNNEIDAETGVIDKNGFNFKMLDYENSKYPVYNPDPKAVVEVAISKFTAESICYWHNKTDTYEDDYEPKDLIGKTIKLNSSKNSIYLITAIIDCGDIPSKYSVLKTSLVYGGTDTNSVLAQDLDTYLNSCAHLNLFVGEGYVDALLKKNNRVVTYTDKYLNTTYTAFPPYDSSNPLSSRFYNENEFTSENVFLFDTKESDTPTAPKLKENEALIHINSLKFLHKYIFRYYWEQTECSKEFENVEIAIEKMALAQDYVRKREAFNEFNKNITKLREFLNERFDMYDDDGDGKLDDISITIKVKEYGDLVETKTLFVKGVYFGVNTDFSVNSGEYSEVGPLVLSESGLKSFGINLEQGHYSRLISPNVGTRYSTNTLANYMSRDEGIKLNWYENNVLNTVEDAKEVVGQFTNLFLYVALALALFSVFMLFNYISTTIVSKRQSIGVLRALGADGKNIFEMFITESLIISLINGVLACIVSFFACQIVNKYVVDVMNLTINFALFDIRQIIVIMAMSLFTGIVSSIIPIIKIAKEKPVDLIRKI